MAMMPQSMDPAITPEEPVEPEGDDLGGQGYVIELTCKSDGTFVVSGPEAVQEEALEENAALGGTEGSAEGAEEPGEVLSTLGEALKKILELVKANPMGESEQASFEAGFGNQQKSRY